MLITVHLNRGYVAANQEKKYFDGCFPHVTQQARELFRLLQPAPAQQEDGQQWVSECESHFPSMLLITATRVQQQQAFSCWGITKRVKHESSGCLNLSRKWLVFSRYVSLLTSCPMQVWCRHICICILYVYIKTQIYVYSIYTTLIGEMRG